MRNTRGVYGLVAVMVLGGGGWLGCGGGASSEPESSPGKTVEEWNELPRAGADVEDALDVSAARRSGSHSCAGLVPSAPGEGRFVNRSRESSACLPGTSDGRGNLALGIYITEFDSAFWTVFTPSGGQRENFNGGAVNTLMPQKSGFHLVSQAFGSDAVSFRVFSRTGALLASRVIISPSTAPGGAWSAAEDPRGGSVVAWSRIGATPGTWQLVVQRFRTSGEPKSPLLTVHEGTGDLPFFTEVGADTQGRVLVLWKEATDGLRGRWLGTSGTFTSKFLVLADALPPTSPIIGERGKLLSPLIGGGFALKQGDAWVARIASKKTSVEPAPAWLVARPRTELSLIRGGRGYALRSSETVGGGSNRLEVLAPAGNSCGDVPLPAGELRDVRVGRDGTVLALAPAANEDVCTYRYWPRLLQ